jgi:hypothetical protein
MIDLPCLREAISPARDNIARCEDIVLAGTFNARAMSPADIPSGPHRTSSRKTLSRLSWARALNAAMAPPISINPEISNLYLDVKGLPYGDCRTCVRGLSLLLAQGADKPWQARSPARFDLLL